MIMKQKTQTKKSVERSPALKWWFLVYVFPPHTSIPLQIHPLMEESCVEVDKLEVHSFHLHTAYRRLLLKISTEPLVASALTSLPSKSNCSFCCRSAESEEGKFWKMVGRCLNACPRQLWHSPNHCGVCCARIFLLGRTEPVMGSSARKALNTSPLIAYHSLPVVLVTGSRVLVWKVSSLCHHVVST